MRNHKRNELADRFLSVGAAAEQLSVHPSTIRRWIDSGRLRAYRLGEKRIGVRRSDLEELATPRPARAVGKDFVAEADLPLPRRMTQEQQRRALELADEFDRVQEEQLARQGKFTPESWELINQARDERSEQLMRAAED
jgi:excisionase family DNA binding protein